MNSQAKTVRIRRSDGSTDSFEVRVDRYTTLLDSLEEIRTHHDHELLYRHSCHHGSCGTCGMIVNGERKLACLTPLAEAEGDVTVTPLTPFPVVGDLAIDPAPLYDDFPEEASYLRESEANAEAEVPDEIDGFVRFENCIECGLCESVCPVQQTFMGPAALAAFGRELEKRPDRADELLPGLDSKRGVWGCDRALKCSQTCPLGVYPARHIAVLQRKIKARRDESDPAGDAGDDR